MVPNLGVKLPLMNITTKFGWGIYIYLAKVIAKTQQGGSQRANLLTRWWILEKSESSELFGMKIYQKW